MMERAKTAPAPDADEKPAAATTASTSAAPTKDASAEDRVSDLERRLNLLGDAEATATTETAPAPAAAPAPVAVAPTKPKDSHTGKTNPLLKRIQAAQERARLAEQQEKQAQLAAAAELERKKYEAEQAKVAAIEDQRIQKAQSALRSVAGRALEDKQKSILAQLEGKSTPVAAVEQPTAAVPIMKSLDPLPPSFDSMKFPPPKEMQQQLQHPHLAPPNADFSSHAMVGHGMNSRVLSHAPPEQQQQQAVAPPSFDFVEQQMMSTPVEVPPPAPTAPTESPSAPHVTMNAETDYLQGVQPVAPPFAPGNAQVQQSMPPPPSFALFEQQQTTNTTQNDEEVAAAAAAYDDGVFDYDLDGNPLSPAQREALMDEQRQLYESIMKEKAMNDEAIAIANADAFDLRSSSAAAAAMPGGETTTHAAHARGVDSMDSVGRNVQGSAAADAANAAALAAGFTVPETDEEARKANRRLVKIGNNQTVALHGQDRTKKAIKEGTAILVQCMSCQNWMQVTDTATLMFCPVCQVVSPVIQQNEVLTKEEAIQLTMDRKLAEKLQAEAYNQNEGEQSEERGGSEESVFSRLFGLGATADNADTAAGALSSSPTTSATAGSAAPSDSWWNKISSIVSYGVADGDRGEMGVTRPPGAPASEYPAQRRGSPAAASAAGARSSPTRNEETRGLLSPVVVDGNEANLPSGRVAEQKPLFSCVMDSVSSATSAMFTTGEGGRDAEGNMYGVDASSLLVTNAGRGVGDGAGDYSKLPDQE